MESYNFFVSGSRQKSRTRTGPGFSALFSRHNFHHTKGNRNRGRELLAFMRCKRFLPWLAALGVLEMASLGDAQEKKGLKKQAVKSYQRYLDLYPHAEDAAKIKKKIEKLYKEVAKEKKN